MAVYKGDTEEEINATDAYNQALQTLAESSVPLAAGGDFASTIRKNWPVGQMKFARGGYAGKGFVKPVAGAVEEAIAVAKKLLAPKPMPQQVIVDPAERAANLTRFMENAKTPPVLYHASHADIPEFKNTKGSHLGFHFGDVEAANTRLEDTAGKFPFPKADLDERRAIMDAHAKNLYAYEDALRRKNAEVPVEELTRALEAGEDIGPIFKKYDYVPTPEEQAQLNQLRQIYESSQTPIIQPGGVGANIGPYHVGITNPLRLPDVGNWGSVKGIKEHLPFDTDARTQAELLSELKGRGYDGIVYQNNVETPIMKTDSYIAFDPEQIKSAIGNAGTFDPTKARVNEAYGGSVGYARGGYATEGYVDDPQSARNVLQPADVKEWNYPTWIESLRDYLAEKGPQTGTGRPTLGGERVANGVRTVLQSLPVSGQIDAAQRSLRSGEHGDYVEAGVDLLGMLPTASIYKSMAREASPALRAAATGMMTSPAFAEMNRPEYLDAPQTMARQELDSVPAFLAAQRSGQKRGMELPYRTAYADGGATDDVFHALRIAHDEANHYGDGGGAKITAELLKKLQSGLGKLMPAGSGYVPVANKPATVKIPTIGEVEARPIPEIGSAAEKYMRSIGREGEHEISGFPKYDVERARKIAQAYEDMQHDPTNPDVKRSYDALVDETMAQYRALKDAGFEFKFNANDPYALSPSMGYADVVNNGRLVVFPTETGGFGSSVHDQSAMQPLLVGVGQVGDLPNATANDAFRAVHDMFGHHGVGNPFFRDEGEERAWVTHKNMYSPEALRAMTNETRGQNSWVNYGPYGEQNRKAKGADTVYAEQKAGLLPDWTMDVPEQYARGGYANGRAVKSVAGSSNEIGEAIATAIKTLRGSVVSSPSIAKVTAKPAQQFPQLQERYPLVLPGKPSIDAVTGKAYIAKDLSDEAKAVAQARAIAQKEIKAGNFDPYYPPENRKPVDPSLHPQFNFDTTTLRATRPETAAKYEAIVNDPRAEQSLIQAILKGKEREEEAGGWYHMNQLHDDYIKYYGPELGPTMFRIKFAESMAATTGGMSPTNNYMLAHYGNFNANQTPYPSNAPQELSLGAYDMPYPIAAGKMGLRNNADAFNKMVLGEAGITPDNPKRYDFAGNFTGQQKAVMDEQMMGGSFGKIDPKLAGAPPPKMYGHFSGKVGEIGETLGMDPDTAQELGWWGFKALKNPGKDVAPQPMIQDVNQAIQRTHLITGMPHDEIVERGVVRQEIPLYAQGGAVEHALRLARGGYADGGIPMPNFAPQGPAIDIYSQVPGVGSFPFKPAMPTGVDNIPSGQQGPSALPSPYTPTPAPAEAASTAYMPEGGGGGGGEGVGAADRQDAADMSGGEDGEGGANDGASSGDNGPGGGNSGEKRGGRIWPKNNTGDNAVRLARLIHEEMRSDPLFERKIQSILSRL